MKVEGIDKIREHEDYVAANPPKPQVIKTTGIVNTSERDYSLLNNVQKINGDNRSRNRSMSRTRSASRTRGPTEPKDWDKRDTKYSTIGGIAKNRLPPSAGPMSMGTFVKRQRSISRSRHPADEGRSEQDANSRGRSSSRVRSAIKGVKNVFGRSSSKARPKLPPSGDQPSRGRGRSLSRREESESGASAPLTRAPSQSEKYVATKAPNNSKIVQAEPEPVVVEKKNEIDKLLEHDVMQLDDKNTVMHVACLLHHNADDVIDRLEEDPSLAFELNNAEELPLHYAAMDKQGVNHDVLKKLLRINPDGVKQGNVQNSLPIHLACMIGAPSQYSLKAFLKMYPKSVMIQSDFPLLFENEMLENVSGEASYDSDDDSEFVTYKPQQTTRASGIASFFACGAPSQTELEIAQMMENNRKQSVRSISEESNEGPQIETGFSPLHLAIMNSAHPSAIELLIKANPKCINLKTSKKRTALDCAQYIVRQHWLYGTDDESAVQNTFAAVDIIEKAMANAFTDE
jgi:ankyrin repeat protein